MTAKGKYWSKQMTPEPLQRWFMANLPPKEMLWGEAQADQVIFVRDRLTQLLARSYMEYKRLPKVISTHTSKSVLLPVYYFDAAWARIILRNNFFNWKISVDSKVGPLELDLEGLCDPSSNEEKCYCEGFSSEWVFPSYIVNPTRFTVDLNSREEAYTFLFLVRRAGSRTGTLDKAYLGERLRHLKTLAMKLKEFRFLQSVNKIPDAQRMHGYRIRDVFESLLAESTDAPGIFQYPDLKKKLKAVSEKTRYKLMDNPELAFNLVSEAQTTLEKS